MYFVLQGADFSKANLGKIDIELGNIGTGGITDPNAEYTLTIQPTPSDATITFILEDGSTITDTNNIKVKYGTKVTVKLQKEDFQENTFTYTIYKDSTRTPEIYANTVQTYTLEIRPTPENATVTIDGIVTRTITVPSQTSVNWSVEAEGFIPQNDVWLAIEDTVLEIDLVEDDSGESGEPETPTNYTITYKYMSGSTSIKTQTTEQVTAGTTKTFSISNAPSVSGYTCSSVSPSGQQTINSNITVTYNYTANSGTGGGEIDTSATRLTSYGTAVTQPSRLADKAYIANVQNSFGRGTTVSYIEFPVAYSTNKVYYTEGNPVTFPVSVWVFDVATNKPIEKLVDGQNFTTSMSTNDNYNCQTVIVPINRTFDYDFYFGYANVPAPGNIALAYGSIPGNYLSGTEFEIGTAIAPGQAYGIVCSIYGTGSIYVEPDDVDDMNQVVYYNETASSVMAGNCYVASRAQTIPANTEIKIMDIKVKGDKIQGANVYVVNADTNIIEEMLLDEATQDSILSTRIGSQVLRLEVNKTYDHPIYFLFNADRPTNTVGMLMKNGVANSILLTDDERKPAVGDDLTDGQWKNGYNIGFAIYN